MDLSTLHVTNGRSEDFVPGQWTAVIQYGWLADDLNLWAKSLMLLRSIPPSNQL